MKVRDIPIEKIFTTGNVRSEDGELGDLVQSLSKRQLQPAGVVQRGERYELLWGHRRLRAAKMLNEQTLACHILQNVSDAEIPLIKLEENIQRKQLTTEEVVAAADEIKKAHPGMADTQIDRILGKQPGYLSNMRSTVRAAQYLVKAGIKGKVVESMSDDELRGMRADLEAKGKEKRGRLQTFHRGDKTPARGIEILSQRGPNVVVICSGPNVKQRVITHLRNLQKMIGT
jgi:ParB/RepB/Spo0J family partition protein